jgi:hypothetical protein
MLSVIGTGGSCVCFGDPLIIVDPIPVSGSGTFQSADLKRALMRPFFGKLWKDPMQSGPSKQGLLALHGVLPTKSEKTGALRLVKLAASGAQATRRLQPPF